MLHEYLHPLFTLMVVDGHVKGKYIFFCRSKSVVKDCFTGQSPGKAISIPAAPDVQGSPAKSKARLLRGGLGHDWCAGVGLGLRREAGW